MKQEKLMTKKIQLKNLIMKQENSEIGKKVLTDGLDQGNLAEAFRSTL